MSYQKSVDTALKNLVDSLKLYSGERFKETRTLAEELLLSLRVAKKLLWWDTYQESLFLRGDIRVDHSQVDGGEIKQLRRILVESVNQIDLNSLSKVNPSQFRKSLKK
ncbi:hypothetical protein LR007_01640 [candidate division NPL-UPA2 bacterium]|nr:hypothetical protein [candidate division NPL-UPA2 bacterium]